MKDKKRIVEIVVISDVHLGTFGSKATELLKYLKSVSPEIIVLNGDIVDIWQFNKRFFPKSHLKIIKYLISLLVKGTQIFYITGNHDEMLRKFNGLELNNFKILNKLVLEVDGKKAWFFHGDVFDLTMKHSKWVAKLGGIGYDLLILLNAFVNHIMVKLGRGKLSFSKRIKNAVKGAASHISDFESTVAEIASNNGYDYVICGHIHQPKISKFELNEGAVMYLNSGDWVENLTALEYNKGQWSLFDYQQHDWNKEQATDNEQDEVEKSLQLAEYSNKELFIQMVGELQWKKPNAEI